VTRFETPADVREVAVVGAGEMGRGIAAVQALAGRGVRLFDVDGNQPAAAMEHVEWAERHDPLEAERETLPCELLVETAKAGERFY